MSQYVDLLATSRWVLVVVLAAAMFDVILPFIPSETIIVAVGVGVAGTGRPLLIWVILAAAAGVLCGDGLAYLIGHRSGPGVTRRLRGGRRGAAIHDWVSAVMRRHGGPLIILGRYVPGARSATAFTAGAVGYPARRYAGFTVVGAVVWATQSALLGYAGGVVFADRPLAGFAAAWLGAGVVTLAAMLVQRGRESRDRTAAPGGDRGRRRQGVTSL
ncbi:DedA family protein [Actinoplanes regularis]|uniref:Membrane protein DedA, SNARE-associated domain n=1 Tax=Actinoplanes regularis TaxID=52697 RepID=A0A238ZQ28_9ACTN|nr:DedA family protein [Actinoplanes regularis]GIE87505.1 membrane protein [Actinoplanes regularis]SNR85556.1 membrane protein DedA, SNARE-associated domain [Actinoplanes regularis]